MGDMAPAQFACVTQDRYSSVVGLLSDLLADKLPLRGEKSA